MLCLVIETLQEHFKFLNVKLKIYIKNTLKKDSMSVRCQHWCWHQHLYNSKILLISLKALDSTVWVKLEVEVLLIYMEIRIKIKDDFCY